MSVYNERLRYPPRSVVGLAKPVADNEPASPGRPPVPPAVPGFVVGHHHGTVTVDVHRRCRADLTLEQVTALIADLTRHRDLAYINRQAAA